MRHAASSRPRATRYATWPRPLKLTPSSPPQPDSRTRTSRAAAARKTGQWRSILSLGSRRASRRSFAAATASSKVTNSSGTPRSVAISITRWRSSISSPKDGSSKGMTSGLGDHDQAAVRAAPRACKACCPSAVTAVESSPPLSSAPVGTGSRTASATAVSTTARRCRACSTGDAARRDWPRCGAPVALDSMPAIRPGEQPMPWRHAADAGPRRALQKHAEVPEGACDEHLLVDASRPPHLEDRGIV